MVGWLLGTWHPAPRSYKGIGFKSASISLDGIIFGWIFGGLKLVMGFQGFFVQRSSLHFLESEPFGSFSFVSVLCASVCFSRNPRLPWSQQLRFATFTASQKGKDRRPTPMFHGVDSPAFSGLCVARPQEKVDGNSMGDLGSLVKLNSIFKWMLFPVNMSSWGDLISI